MTRLLYALVLAAFFLCSGAQARAQGADAKLIGTHDSWSAYVLTENGQKVCYMVAKPQKAEGNYTRRGDVFAIVTHRPGEKSKNVFSYIAGYPYKAGSDVKITVNGKTFTLFTRDQNAWTVDSRADEDLSESIRAGSTMIVKGVSQRGTQTTDTFSLKGSSAAHQAISRACGGA